MALTAAILLLLSTKWRTCGLTYSPETPHSHRKIYLLTPRSRVFLVKLTVSQPVKNPTAFYGTRRFITAFTSARHLSLSWTSSIKSIPPHSTSWRSILTLFSHLRLGVPSGLFPSGFSTKTLYTPHFSPMHATFPVHFIFGFITRTILSEEYRILSSSLCSFLHSLLTLLNINVIFELITQCKWDLVIINIIHI